MLQQMLAASDYSSLLSSLPQFFNLFASLNSDLIHLKAWQILPVSDDL
jgi:hypothetical protein